MSARDGGNFAGNACYKCAKDLSAHRFIIHHQETYCIPCYETQFANTCVKCKTLIGTDSRDLTYKGKHWHEACFACSKCTVNLYEKPFALLDNQLHCSSCYDQYNAVFCEECKLCFQPGSTKYDFNGKHWHEECFRCLECQNLLGGEAFVPINDSPVCMQCYERNHAYKCFRCNEIVSSGGVWYRDQPWHGLCFRCEHCDRGLAQEKFKTTNDKPYCIDCTLKLFAKKCVECKEPIGDPHVETKFVSFDDKHWHADCFKCMQCQTNLVGNSFAKRDTNLLCKDCVTKDTESQTKTTSSSKSKSKSKSSGGGSYVFKVDLTDFSDKETSTIKATSVKSTM